MANILIDTNIYQTGKTNFYSVNGFGNNQTNTSYGAVGSVFLNTAPLDYGDGISSPAGADRPNPRVISNTLAQQDNNIVSDRGLTNLIWVFGQFLDHDITFTPENSASRISFAVPKGDPYLDPNNTGTVNISLNNTAFVSGTGTSVSNPAQIANGITAWIDGSNIYGSAQTNATSLRSGTGGLLKTSAGNLLPFAPPDPNRPNVNSFIAGDNRVNENSALVAMHTLFMREHNRLAAELAIAHPEWTDEQLYQRARQINIAQYQAVVYREYLPSLLGVGIIPEYRGYNPSINPNLENSFSSASYRVGHTQLGSKILRLDPNGKQIPEGSLTLSEVFFRSADVIQQAGADPILRGIASSLSEKVDVKIINDIRNLLFSFSGTTTARDLFAINIQRGRLNGISDYNTVRDAFGLREVSSFAEITSDVDLQNKLASLYGNVNNIDLYVALLAEDHAPGSAVGKTFQALVAKQFLALREGDRFYYENIFTSQEIAEIEKATFSEIMRRNTNTTIIQDTAFSLLNQGSGNSERINGGLGNDSIYGGLGNDTLIGFQGDDLLFGEDGSDFLLGVDGRNLLNGGNGNDTYQLNLNAFGSEIRDSSGTDALFITNNDLNLDALNPQNPSSFGTVALSLNQPAPNTLGIAKLGNDLIIDLNRDGVANATNDLKVSNFFDNAGREGTGFIDTINNVSGGQILNHFNPNTANPVVHRFFRQDIGSHFYTTSEVEKQSIQNNLPQYKYEGTSFKAIAEDDSLTGAKPVYRFFNKNSGAHLYTISDVEKNYIQDNLNNYTFENVAYYAYDTPQANTIELYRFYQPQGDFHFFTPSVIERDYVMSNLPNYQLESNGGVAFYIQAIDV
ncbi:putative heme peroxidase [Chondrocystis sp. NIES-4102]|nr:putative heme peroxidase [Chondrocystis sp. NIES-4102]